MIKKHRLCVLLASLMIILFFSSLAHADNNTAARIEAQQRNSQETQSSDAVAPAADMAQERIGVVPEGTISEERAAQTSAFLNELSRVTEEFRTFGKSWINHVDSNYMATETHKDVKKVGSMYVARYYKIDPVYMDIQVKPYESKTSPYIGILKYIEHVYECKAPTKEAALSGKFASVDSTRITEIFRYSKGSWGGAK